MEGGIFIDMASAPKGYKNAITKDCSSAPLTRRQKIIRSICKENLQFSENKVRTEKLNELVSLIGSIIKEKSRKRNGTDEKKSRQSHIMIAVGQISKELVVDKRVLFDIFEYQV